MVLFIDRTRLCTKKSSILDQVLEESYIRYTCATFLTSALCLRDCSSFLHVFQGEIAAKIRTEGGPVRWAGSSAATTCVIAVFVDPHTELASVCHFDNFTSCSASCIEECLDGMDAPFLYLVGGYSDTRGLGPGTCEQLLAYFHKLKMNISLQLCCVAKLNTDALGAPTCQSLAVDLHSLAAYPAVFANKGPLAIPRLAQMWVQDGQPRLNNIFDPCQQQIVLRLEKGGGDRRLLRALLHLADISPSQFLHQVSTSPEHEEPEFLGDMRSALRWLLDCEGPHRRVQHTFQWEATGWHLVEEMPKQSTKLAAPRDGRQGASGTCSDAASGGVREP